MKIDLLSLFPEMVEASLSDSILKRAIELKILNVHFHQLRDFSYNKHRKVDDAPYGGGKGLVMYTDVVDNALIKLKTTNSHMIYFSPKGKTLEQNKVIELSKHKHIIMLCGHYEGIDQRIIDKYVDEEISIGDYVLTGGELPAAVTIDAISRHLEGVLGKMESLDEESFNNHLLEYPHYTRPADYKGLKVPDILLSGNHGKIEEWRYLESLKITSERRNDLFHKHILGVLLEGDKKKIMKLSKLLNQLDLSGVD